MAARAIWKGVIRFGDFRLPVKLYSAAVDRTVHFHLLHEQDLTRVRQRLVDPETGDVWDYQETRRGCEVERGVFVMLNEQELAAAEPEASREIAVDCFVDPPQVHHQWYLRPYYLGPDGDRDTYFTLVQALQREQLVGIAQWVFRRKQYAGALRSEGGALMLITMRYAGEVIAAAELEPPKGREFQRKERDMAEQLLHTLDSDFQPEEFHDEYRQRVLDLIEAKRTGEQVEVAEAEPDPTEEDSLSNALEASLSAAR
jgi:DNA end-binding protein Ku